MKKILIIILGFLLAPIFVVAQPTEKDGYRPMLKEGKAWNYIYVKVDIVEIEDGRKVEEEMEIPECFYLKGDTVIGGRKCMKMYLNAQGRDTYDSSWYEEGYKVYRIMEDETEAQLIFDFGLQIGENPTFQFGELLSLASTDQVEVNGRRFYRQNFTQAYGWNWEDASICVAGVGGSYDIGGIFNGGVYGVTTCICDYSYFVSCEEDGEVIFTRGDFNKEAYVEPEPVAGYRPFVKEGKTWYYKNYIDGRPEEYNYEYSYVLQGDTIVGGKACLKLYLRSDKNGQVPTYTAAMYEEGGKVFYFPQGLETAELLYDFTKGVGETVWEKSGEYYQSTLKIDKEDVVSVNGQELRRFKMSHFWGSEKADASSLWIEGVGSNKDLFHVEPLAGNYNQFEACYENGQPIFAANDFYKTPTSELPEGYHGFIKEGKTWNVAVNRKQVSIYIDNDGNELIDEETGKPKKFVKESNFPKKYVMKGSRIIDGHTCMDMYSYSDVDGERYCCSWYEDGEKVYQKMIDEELKLIYDFSLEPGDILPLVNDCKLKTVDKLNTKGKWLSRFTFAFDNGQETFSYVEGVGGKEVSIGYSYRNDLISLAAKHSTDLPEGYTEIDVYWESGDYEEFISCEEDGKVIFTNEDFAKPGETDGISPINNEQLTIRNTGRTYDLQGREVTTPQPGHIYIRDGRKFIER